MFGNIRIISDEWQTERLTVRNSRDHEVRELQELYKEFFSYFMNFSSPGKYSPLHIRNCLEKGDLPPGGLKRCYQLKSIYRNRDMKLIGFFAGYHGYPEREIFYIGQLFIRSDFQGKGVGGEVVERCVAEVVKAGFRELRLTVDIKNWPAIRFWLKNGFDRITTFVGDKEYSNKSSAKIELARTNMC